MTWSERKNRILCSRPFLALHVLMGKPVIYRATISGPFVMAENKGGRMAGSKIVYRPPPTPEDA